MKVSLTNDVFTPRHSDVRMKFVFTTRHFPAGFCIDPSVVAAIPSAMTPHAVLQCTYSPSFFNRQSAIIKSK
jgi:hypothetical protein